MKHKLGFTLIELLVAVAVIALILGFIIPASKPHPMSPHRRTLRNMSDIDWYPYGYYCENNKWPDEASWKEDIKECEFGEDAGDGAFELLCIKESGVFEGGGEL